MEPVYLLFSFLAFIISVAIVRWIFNISDFLRYQKQQYMMLRQIAHKLGVDQEYISEIDDPALYRRRKRAEAKQTNK